MATGFAKDHLLMTSFDPRLVQYNATQTQQFYKLLAERMRETPGVQSEALTQNVPLGRTILTAWLLCRTVSDAAGPREFHFDDGHRG